MVDVYGFLNPEDMFAILRKMTDEANKGLAPQQVMVTYGSHWVRFYDVANRVVVFSKVMTEAEFVAEESSAGADPDEIAFGLQRVKDRHDMGFMFGVAYSILEPSGEYGDTHRTNLWPVDERLFEAARLVEWEIDRLPEAARFLLEEAYMAFRGHVREQRRGEG